MELLLLHFLSFPNNFNVFHAISPAHLCREETPQQAFLFRESKHLNKSKSLTCSSTLDSCLFCVLLCTPATFWDQPVTRFPGFVRAIKRQVCPLPSRTIYRPRASQSNPHTSRKRGLLKGTRLDCMSNVERNKELALASTCIALKRVSTLLAWSHADCVGSDVIVRSVSWLNGYA